MVKRALPTSHDVARVAGVSQATVSGVLNETNIRVSEATRRRVLATAEALGYTPDPHARALRRQRGATIGFVPSPTQGLPAIQPLSVAYQLGIHLTRAAIRREYQIVEASAGTAQLHTSPETVQSLLRRRVDGIILDRPQTMAEVERVLDSGVPVVQLLRPQPVLAPTMTVDAAPGTAAALAHLVELGHRRIAFIGLHGTHPVDRARFDAFEAELARHAIAVPAEYVRLMSSYAPQEGRAATQQLLALPERPTALFVASDGLAIGALHALHEARVRVPDAMSVICYDDFLAAFLTPPLSSVAQPFADLAERAVALIAARVEGEPQEGEAAPQIALPTQFVVRHSTQPPPAGHGARRESIPLVESGGKGK